VGPPRKPPADGDMALLDVAEMPGKSLGGWNSVSARGGGL
jgi:hypothetical protein